MRPTLAEIPQARRALEETLFPQTKGENLMPYTASAYVIRKDGKFLINGRRLRFESRDPLAIEVSHFATEDAAREFADKPGGEVLRVTYEYSGWRRDNGDLVGQRLIKIEAVA
jgi:hypothetical protein